MKKIILLLLLVSSCKQDKEIIIQDTSLYSNKSQSEIILIQAIGDAQKIINNHASSQRENEIKTLLNYSFSIFERFDMSFNTQEIKLEKPLTFLIQPILSRESKIAGVIQDQVKSLRKPIIYFSSENISKVSLDVVTESVLHEMVHVAQALDSQNMSLTEREIEAYKISSSLMLKKYGIETKTEINKCFFGLEDFNIRSKQVSQDLSISEYQAKLLLIYNCTENIVQFTENDVL